MPTQTVYFALVAPDGYHQVKAIEGPSTEVTGRNVDGPFIVIVLELAPVIMFHAMAERNAEEHLTVQDGLVEYEGYRLRAFHREERAERWIARQLNRAAA